ncbi:sterol carrier protein domain-containing protein [Aneurinibacillus migulanus]|uniref:Sterol carrier protein domain-containing protein n=2 Tax=Aneurinibacillus migulanus TaxID=47500 RepID=A0A1G8XAP3_ANEMI|nr:sterol carrier protein domain-containing protein [Aneurinibacillus migulanus]GED14900.1 hypothetical protein AMI01nite_28910 [Aneurinibacillus migulanus]SDJ87484.1 Sterol carrier protein domain-containing protein [Aneurinibacillus migulanus]
MICSTIAVPTSIALVPKWGRAPCASIKETIAPYYMARIVDLRLFLEKYPFQSQEADCQLTFTLHDPMLEWNQGTFTLAVDKEGKGHLTEGGANATVALERIFKFLPLWRPDLSQGYFSIYWIG